MELEISREDDNALIKVNDSSLVGVTVDKLKIEAVGMMEEGVKKITLDLASTNYIDSSGIGKLLFINKKLNSMGGEIEIVNITPILLDFFETLAIDRIITIKK